MKVIAIFKKEMQNYFLSPLAYIIVGFFLMLAGYFFATFILSARLASMEIPLANISFILIFTLPILTMHLLAEEKKQGTEQLLFTSPLTARDVVLGKFLSATFLLLIMLGLTLVYPVILFKYGNPELGPIISGYLGIFLFGAAAIAIGIFASSLTENQLVAAIIGFSFLLFFWIIDWAASAVPQAREFFNYLSILYHLEEFRGGVIDLQHIFYYLSLMVLFLFLTVENMEKRRWS